MEHLRITHRLAVRISGLVVLSTVALIVGCDVSTSTGTTSTGPFYAITTDVRDSLTYAAGTSIAVPIRVTREGSAVGGAPARWTILAGRGYIPDSLSTTDTLGATRIVWTLGRTPEMNALVVTVGDAADTLYAAGIVGAPSSIAIVGAQTATVSTGSPVVLQVVIKDRPGNVVPNTTVKWTSSGGSISASTSISNATGVATTAFAASAPGTYHVTADLPELATCIFEVVVRP